MLTRSTVTFSGSVQGVGFRVTAVNVSRRFKVEGLVRNERNGTVKCIVEGEKPEVDRFVSAVERAMEGVIEDTKIEESAATGEFIGQGFEIRQ